MQTTQKIQLNLIDPFFNEELDYKNDFVSYINVSGTSSVTPKNNNSEKSLDNEYHRGIDNPLTMYCPMFCIENENIDNSLFIWRGSFCLMFVYKDYIDSLQYQNIYKKFNVFELNEVA